LSLAYHLIQKTETIYQNHLVTMRLTRAALRAEVTPNLLANDAPDASAIPLPPSPSKERVPLGEVSANPLNEHPAPTTMAPAKKTKAKGGRKGAKGKKGKKAEQEPEQEPETTETDHVEVLEDERKAAASPASDAAVGELANVAPNGMVQVPMNDERPASPPSRAVRMTRRQLAKIETQTPNPKKGVSAPRPESAQKSHDRIASPEKKVPKETIPDKTGREETSQEETAPVTTEEAADIEHAPQDQPETLHAPLLPQSAIVDELEQKIISAEQPCGQEEAPKRTPSKSPARTPMRLEESIEAIDALEEAIEQVGKAIPVFDHESDERCPQRAHFNTRTTPARRAKTGTAGTAKKSQPIAPLRLSRNPTAPVSLKSTVKTVAAPRIREASTSSKPSLVRSLSSRAAPTKVSDGKGKTVAGEASDYLASKRRPISMSFPAPPPPPRSSKPLTKSAFQLPGEAVAAKLKAQKEERLKREAEEVAKKANFKARPAPVRKASVPVKQTVASKARENLLLQGVKQGGGDGKSGNAPAQALSRSSSFSSASNGKRQSNVLSSSRPTFATSTSSSTAASNRLAHTANPGPLTKSAVTAADVATQRVKAREIFNRDKLEKEQKEMERKEKEEAAKRARAEAAERGRIASREWAEKQKLKKMGMAPAITAKAALTTQEA
jgi:hypothetical protein